MTLPPPVCPDTPFSRAASSINRGLGYATAMTLMVTMPLIIVTHIPILLFLYRLVRDRLWIPPRLDHFFVNRLFYCYLVLLVLLGLHCLADWVRTGSAAAARITLGLLLLSSVSLLIALGAVLIHRQDLLPLAVPMALIALIWLALTSLRLFRLTQRPSAN